MQQDRLDGWMVRQIEKVGLAKETVIQLPIPKPPGTGPFSARITRPSAATPRRIKGGVAASRRSLPAVAGQEMCCIVPAQDPPVLAMLSSREISFQRRELDESVETKWRAQFHDRQQPRIEGGHVDRTKVLHNMQKKQHSSGDDQSPLFLWGLPREHILDFIRQSMLPSSWANPKSRPACEWEAVPDEEDEAARIRRVM
ncbi:hypothetical protein V7S43_011975 [Phytophthora oleae]|uniref:Uncharacterized protein n=1 Tax=Phytophthora oleae TaxID=2107226 RepID=A0ABD3FDE3_9STRA